MRFQSTRPVRGATPSTRPAAFFRRCFNPRAPYGARPQHAIFSQRHTLFQSTRPVRGATFHLDLRQRGEMVSIHAPRTGRDDGHVAARIRDLVSIHAPRTGRDDLDDAVYWRNPMFQSTRPVRGATTAP